MVKFLRIGSLTCLLTVIMAEAALAQTASASGPSGITSNILTQYQTAAKSWGTTLNALAQHIFLTLAIIELAWSFVWWTLEKNGPDEVIIALLRKVMGLSFFWALLTNAPTWIPAIINSFSKAGQAAANVQPLSPGAVFQVGLTLASNIGAALGQNGFGISTLGLYVVGGIAALFIIAAFAVIAASLLITLIESYIVIAAGVILLGFASSRWTSPFAEKYLSSAVAIGMKLFITYLIIGVGNSLTAQWAAMISPTQATTVQNIAAMLGAAIIYMAVVWQIPGMATSLLSGTVNMTLGSTAAAAGAMTGAVGGAAVGGALGGAALAKGAASSVGGAIKAGQAAIAGGSLRGGGIGGAASALGAGLKAAAAHSISGIGDKSAGGKMASTINAQSAGLREQQAAVGPAPEPPTNASSGTAGVGPAPGAPGSGPDSGLAGGGSPPAASGSGSTSGQAPAGGSATANPASGEGSGSAASVGQASSGPQSQSTAPAPPAGQTPAANAPDQPGTSPLQAARDASRTIQQAMATPNDQVAGASLVIPLKHHE